MNKQNKFQIDFANALGMLASRFSLNPTVGQLYGLLYMSPEPASLNEMVQKLGVSKGAVSTNIRILESWGAVKKVWVDNSRKDYYEANPDTLGIIKKRLVEGIRKRINEAKNSLDNLSDKLNKTNNDYKKEKENFYSDRLQNAKDMYEDVKNLIDLFAEDEK